jgi:tetratricopeptide (TPR) repeat protein
MRLASGVSSIKLGDALGNPDFPNTGDRQAALREYQRALPLFQGLPESQVAPRLRFLGVVHERLGRIHEALDDRATALTHYRTSLEYRQAHVTAQPADTEALRNVGIAHEKIAGMLAASGDAPGALASYRTALGRYDALYRADRQNAQAARTLLIGYEHVAAALLATGDPAGADRAFAEAVGLADGLLERAPGQWQVRQDRARLLLARADAGATSRQVPAGRRCGWVAQGGADQRALAAAGHPPPADLAEALATALAACR